MMKSGIKIRLLYTEGALVFERYIMSVSIAILIWRRWMSKLRNEVKWSRMEGIRIPF